MNFDQGEDEEATGITVMLLGVFFFSKILRLEAAFYL